MTKKIIYISSMPYSDKIKRDWYAKIFCENDYDVEFWDVSTISDNTKTMKQVIVSDGIKLISNVSYCELSKLLIKNQKLNIIYIILASFHKQTSKIYMILKKHNPYTVFFNT